MFSFVDSTVITNGNEKPEDWAEPMTRLKFMIDNIYWWLGDMVNMGEARFGDDIYQHFPDGISPELVDRCSSMAKHFPRSRRNPALSWAHHAAVSGLDERIQVALLNKAQEQGWSSAELREQAKSWKRKSEMTPQKSGSSQENYSAG